MDKFMSIISKIANQRHLVAIRDGFVSMMPLLIIGSIATLINQIPGIINTMKGIKDGDPSALKLPEIISTINGNIWWGTFGMIALIATFAIAYNLAKYYDSDRLAAGIIALVSYLAITPQTIEGMVGEGEAAVPFAAWGNLNINFTNAQGLFVGIIIALLATECFVRLRRNPKLVIKMPDGVPPAVGRSFSALIPGAGTILVITAIFTAIAYYSGKTIFTLITEFVSQPLMNTADSLGYALIIVFFNQILWFFGLHGSNILEAIIQPISLPMMEANAAAAQANEAIPHIVTKPFLDTFIYIGGSGALLGMIIAILLLAKSKQMRTVGKLSVAPACFNINEPTIFGLPIVLNMVLLVPFILGPLIITLVSYGALAAGIVPKVIAILPWATPPFISGFLATGGAWQGVALQVVNILISFVIYLPFILMADKIERKKEAAAEAA